MSEIRKMLRFIRPYWKWALLAFVLLLVMALLDLSIPRLIQRIIDQGIRQKDMPLVLQTAALMVGISVLDALVAVLNNIYSIRVGESVARDVREALFRKVQDLSYGDLDRFSTGRLMIRLASDTGAVQRLVQVSLRIGTRGPLLMAGSVVLMFLTSRTLAMSMLPLLAVAAVLILLFSSRMEPNFRRVQQRLDRLNTVLQETIAGARLVKAFVRGTHEEQRFGATNQALAGSTIRVMQFMAAMSPVLTLLVNAGMVLVVWQGGLQSIRGTLSLGQIVAFSNYLLTTLTPLTMLAQLSNTWANGIASAGRINEVLDTQPEVKASPHPIELSAGAPPAVAFEHVDFRYNGHTEALVLEDVSLEANPGETLAILGATGSGKTTLVNLVPRFYDPTAGTVRLGGVDVKDLAESALRRHIAIVPQEAVLFTGTIGENICFGRPGASQQEIEQAARIAQADGFIQSFPEGYATRVEERGGNLSGGQKQRIAIARALITRPDILILDDSTSAVDVETETRIQDGLAQAMRGRTTLVVAQRISTVLRADRIIVLDGGRIAASGRHRDLLGSSPIYREIYDSQLGGGLH